MRIATVLPTCLAAFMAMPAAAATSRQPNIVLILLDDLDTLVSGPYLPEVMPRMTALKKDGVDFTAAFAPTPICCAARASILTGSYGHNTGVLTNGGPHGGWESFHRNGGEARSIAKLLHERGYLTGAFGKYMNGYAVDDDGHPPQVPVGWDEWQIFVDQQLQSYKGYDYTMLVREKGTASPRLESHGHAEADYSTDVIAEKTKRFLASAVAERKPFFAYVAPTAPHFPLPAAPRHSEVARKWVGTLPQERLNFFSDGDSFDDKPLWLRSTLALRSRRHAKVWNSIDWNNRMGSLYAADDLVGGIKDELERLGVWNDSILIVTSDNGYNLGAHGLLHKMAPYEESIRIPMIIAAGPGILLRREVRENESVALIDIAPSLLSWTGSKDASAIAANMDGQPLQPLLMPDPKARAGWKERDLLFQYDGENAGHGIGVEMPRDFVPALLLDLPSYRAIRVKSGKDAALREHLYVEWFPGQRVSDDVPPSAPLMLSQHEFELYDLTADPAELKNLRFYELAAETELMTELQKRLETLSHCRGATCRR